MRKFFIILSLIVVAVNANIIGTSELLDISKLNVLENWLGQGELDVTNIFTKVDGSTSIDFHAAADLKGATFSLIEISDDTRTEIIGGYNPVSWDKTINGYVISPESERDAFIFNLTTDLKIDQNSEDLGGYQTYNRSDYGPMFGGGSDIRILEDLNIGYANQSSYGDVLPQYETSLTTINTSEHPYDAQLHSFTVGKLEVFSIASKLPVTSVPEPGSLSMVLFGSFAIISLRFKKRKS